jgi:subtilisin family serine protease
MASSPSRVYVAVLALLLTPTLGLAASLKATPRTAPQTVTVFVELEEPSTLEVYTKRLQATGRSAGVVAMAVAENEAGAMAESQLAAVHTSQEAFAAQLTAAVPEAEEVYRVGTVMNGFALKVPPSRVATLRGLPGVRSVRPIVPKKLMDGSFSILGTKLIDAPLAWDPSGLNLRGDGVRVAIIDTGIDYIHRDLGGDGNYSGKSFTGSSAPWTAKVVGGYDFAGDDYDSTNTPKPDGDPMDCAYVPGSGQNCGHGSHVAGILAGYGLNGDGSRYTGAYSPALAYLDLSIAPGVAPGAKLYAYRVFGTYGGTNLLIQAIDRALDPNKDGNIADHVDVISMSLGSFYGTGEDADSVAVNRAVAAGVTVVAAGGNEDDGHFIVGDPGDAAGAISVASVGDDGNMTYTLTVNSPSTSAGDYAAAPAEFGPPVPDAGLTGDLVRADPADACASLNNAKAIAGKVALIDRGTCNFVDKVKRAQQAGAVAVVVVDNTDEDLKLMWGNGTGITIPACLIAQADGIVLKMKLPSPGVNLTLFKAGYADVMSYFSSRGPRQGDFALKPDVAAPGDGVISIASGSGTDYAAMGGTSMATPQVAGMMAVVKQAHPGWTPEELKAVAMNTAEPDVYTNPNRTVPKVGPGRIGAGRVDVAAAAESTLVAFVDPGSNLVSVNFGKQEVVGFLDTERSVRVENKGSAPAVLTVAYTAVAHVPGVEVSLPGGDTVTVPAGGSVDVPVRLRAVASYMKHTHDPGYPETAYDYPRVWMSEEAGYLVLTPQTGPTLRLPVYAAPRPASLMTARATFEQGSTGGTATLHFDGLGVNTGTAFPNDVVSLATPLELQEVKAPSTTLASEGLEYADIKYVGVATDYPAKKAAGKGLSDSFLYLGVVMQQPWSSPVEINVTVLLDVNNDGNAEYIINTGDLDLLTQWDPLDFPFDTGADVPIALVCDSAMSNCGPTYLQTVSSEVRDTAVFGSNAMVIRIPLDLAGISEQKSRVKYQVITSRNSVDETLDQSQTHTFDPVHPGLTFTGIGYDGNSVVSPLYLDLPGSQAVVELSTADYQVDSGLGALVIHHHNASNRAQVVAIGAGACAPTVVASAPTMAKPGEEVTLQATATGTGCAGEPTLTWSFGDGSTPAAGSLVTHTYAATGSYVWSVTASYGTYSTVQSGTVKVQEDARGTVRRLLPHGGA